MFSELVIDIVLRSRAWAGVEIWERVGTAKNTPTNKIFMKFLVKLLIQRDYGISGQ